MEIIVVEIARDRPSASEKHGKRKPSKKKKKKNTMRLPKSSRRNVEFIQGVSKTMRSVLQNVASFVSAFADSSGLK